MKFLIALTLTALCSAALPPAAERRAQYLSQHPDFAQQLDEHYNSWKSLHAADSYTPGDSTYTCPSDVTGASATVPTNVNAVRPGDIKAIGALGDSISAGNGALAHDLAGVLDMFKGVVFSIGGDHNLAYTVSVPNVIRKVHNPTLYGQAYGSEVMGLPTNFSVHQFDYAIPGSEAPDMPGQARNLVAAMKNNSHVNYTEDWKLVTVFFGGNDACAYCHEPEKYSAQAMTGHLRTTLQILSEMPRTIVQLLGMFHLEVLREVGRRVFICQTLRIFECACADDGQFSDSEFSKFVAEYQQAQHAVEMKQEFERDDFTFIVQPGIEQTMQVPLNSSGQVDLPWFAPDCFHFSIKGHNTVARFLWNNMVQPIGGKVNNYNLSHVATPLMCPDPSCPFIRTIANSKDCSKFMPHKLA